MLLQNMVVRVPEGDGLEFLTQRAMRWLDRARDFLAKEEVSDALLLTEPVGVLRIQDIPEKIRKAYQRNGSGEYVAVWRPGSGATITVDIVEEAKVIKGMDGMSLWNKQLKDFIGKAAQDPRICTVDPKSKVSSSSIENTPKEILIVPLPVPATASTSNGPGPIAQHPTVVTQQVNCPPSPPRLATSAGGRSPSSLETANALMTLCAAPVVPELNYSTDVDQSFPSTSKSAMLRYQPKSEDKVEPVYFEKKPPAPKRVRRKSLLLNRDPEDEALLRGPRVRLPDALIQELDNLLVEIDLMEVSISESDQLYRLREFTKPPVQVLDISVRYSFPSFFLVDHSLF